MRGRGRERKREGEEERERKRRTAQQFSTLSAHDMWNIPRFCVCYTPAHSYHRKFGLFLRNSSKVIFGLVMPLELLLCCPIIKSLQLLQKKKKFISNSEEYERREIRELKPVSTLMFKKCGEEEKKEEEGRGGRKRGREEGEEEEEGG